MSLKGSAFIIMWHDIAPEHDADYNLWHTRQHMPERLDHPGFLRSRRGVNAGAAHQKYFTLYEGEALDTFISPEYARSLNHPTEWTRRVAPHFQNFLRMACEVRSTNGRGGGGGLISARITLQAGFDASAAELALNPALKSIADIAGVTGVHLAVARPAYSDQKTSETSLRPEMNEAPFDLVVIAETIGLAEAEAEIETVRAQIVAAGCAAPLVQAYDIAYTLERREADKA
jgi:hypothetical protein